LATDHGASSAQKVADIKSFIAANFKAIGVEHASPWCFCRPAHRPAAKCGSGHICDPTLIFNQAPNFSVKQSVALLTKNQPTLAAVNAADQPVYRVARRLSWPLCGMWV
jgi:hypothetical protein